MEKVQIIPPPKDVDPRALAWKGAAVLGKMDGVADLWVTPADWVRLFSSLFRSSRSYADDSLPGEQEILGMRALKERCFFLS